MEKGETIEIRFEISAPCDATEAELEEWVNFELGWRGGMSLANPLSKHAMIATGFGPSID